MGALAFDMPQKQENDTVDKDYIISMESYSCISAPSDVDVAGSCSGKRILKTSLSSSST